VSWTLGSLFDKVLGTVTETLYSAITNISFSFDLWTSKNNVAMLGLCAHFLNIDGESITSLLSMPRQFGSHTGLNIAETVSGIIAHYHLEGRLGYWTTDNASNNETCLDQLAKEYGFEASERWIRCCGHVFNLVGQAALLGSNPAALPQDTDCFTEESELCHWRQRGLVGKLHNLVYWINRSPQRCDKFIALQLELITLLKTEDKQDTYQLTKDVETRWNSFYDSATRAIYLRPAIDELLLQERLEFDKYIARCEQSGRPIKLKRPAILDDALSNDDWSVVVQCTQILKPLKDATMLLQGHVGGKFRAIWQVIPQYDKMLTHFEKQVELYPVTEPLKPSDYLTDSLDFSQHVPEATQVFINSQQDDLSTAERHFATNIKLAWTKLDEYYSKLENTPVYVAAVELHPRFKWKYFEKHWSIHPSWIKEARTAFSRLLGEWQYQVTAHSPPPARSPPKKRRRLDDDDEQAGYSSDDDIELGIDQQMSQYLFERYNHTLVPDTEANPVQYWLSKRSDWPQLAAMALNIYSIPVMSDEPKRVFSETGAAVPPRRRLLQSDTISHMMCLRAWVKSNIVTMDSSLFSRLPLIQTTQSAIHVATGNGTPY